MLLLCLTELSKGIYEDKSGAVIVKTLEDNLKEKITNIEKIIIPDEYDTIFNTLNQNKNKFDIIITTGGTGLSKRDVTPEATEAFCKKKLEEYRII
ncbi:molybdopterin-binding protein [Brachyspira hyodysenteriae]|nr:molybdopterin-binding protein [Brachyspira hyodysenteriae]MDA0065696.1 molybdopterin-binding protein [Brachyspira hyodysenteriae]MDA0088665.1 molybdopterin-binding protein [Brachyspira hyodysenteriae]